MADQKLSQLTAATLPLTGSELAYLVQGGNQRRATAATIAGTLPDATTSTAGKLSATDKARLDQLGADDSPSFTGLTITGTDPVIIPHIHGALAGPVYEHVRNVSGSTMAALTPYHVVGSQGDTDRVQVIPADASDPSSMPASGILMTALANNEDGHGVIAGVSTGLNTVANPSGTVLYVGTGVLTPTAPAANVQAIAIVGRSHASTGTLAIIGGTSLARVAHTGAYGDLSGRPTLGSAAAADASAFAPAAQGVTNGNSHNHDGGDGAQIAYSSLSGTPTLADLGPVADDIIFTISNRGETATVSTNYDESLPLSFAVTITKITFITHIDNTGSSTTTLSAYKRAAAGTKTALLSTNATLGPGASVATGSLSGAAGVLSLAYGDRLGVDLIGLGTGASGIKCIIEYTRPPV